MEAALDFLPLSSSHSPTLLSAAITVLTLTLSLSRQWLKNQSSILWYFTFYLFSFSPRVSDSELLRFIFIFVIEQVDAFTDSAFKGNPAAVCLLEEERDEKWLQALAAEFNISETCYLIRMNDEDDSLEPPKFSLRWFTPVAEVFHFPLRFYCGLF